MSQLERININLIPSLLSTLPPALSNRCKICFRSAKIPVWNKSILLVGSFHAKSSWTLLSTCSKNPPSIHVCSVHCIQLSCILQRYHFQTTHWQHWDKEILFPVNVNAGLYQNRTLFCMVVKWINSCQMNLAKLKNMPSSPSSSSSSSSSSLSPSSSSPPSSWNQRNQ